LTRAPWYVDATNENTPTWFTNKHLVTNSRHRIHEKQNMGYYAPVTVVAYT